MHLSEGIKEGLVRAIDEVRMEYAVTLKHCCSVLELCPERYKRWTRLYEKEGRYGGGKTGPKTAPHTLLEEERQKIVEMAKKEEYADLSHRQLSIVASEEDIVEASSSTVYRELKKAGLQSGNSKRKANRIQEKPEAKAEKPNQVWSWDLTYIAIGPIFVYLFAIIDVFSRKIVGWHLSLDATVASMKKAWDKALSNEELIGVIGAPCLPTALSDHGVQMAKKTAKQFFRDLGIKQLFARYQTPRDNAWIESWFRILKYDCLRFKDYVSFDQLRTILGAFIEYYNNKRYHGAIGYVTPSQMHDGEAERLLKKGGKGGKRQG
jgi:transposase InsO family protein